MSGPDVPDAATFVRYTHLDKTHGYLPGMHASQAAVFGLDEAGYQRLREHFAAQACEAATALLDDPSVSGLVDAWGRRGPHTLLAVGDSLTDDLQSWLEILRAALDLRAPGHAVRVVNGGLSAHSTAMVLRRWPATLTAVRPDVVVCCLGGNDVTRVGPGTTKPVVGPDESAANLREIRHIAAHTGDPDWIWMTPTPVDEDRVAGYPPFRLGQSRWANDDVLALVERMRAFPDPVVDLTAALGVPPGADLVEEDGVHPTLAGQAAIAVAALRAIVGAS